jgi:hypothetical protein
MFPETVGRSLEEVEEIFQQGHVFSAWKISRDVGKKTVEEVLGQHKSVSPRLLVSKTRYLSTFFTGQEVRIIGRGESICLIRFLTLNVFFHASKML